MTRALTLEERIARGTVIQESTCETIEHLRSLPYSDYRGSRWWKRRRVLYLESLEYVACACCDMANTLTRDGQPVPLQMSVHHRSYEHLGCEPDHDLALVCSRCHNLIHRPESSAARMWLAVSGALLAPIAAALRPTDGDDA